MKSVLSRCCLLALFPTKLSLSRMTLMLSPLPQTMAMSFSLRIASSPSQNLQSEFMKSVTSIIFNCALLVTTGLLGIIRLEQQQYYFRTNISGTLFCCPLPPFPTFLTFVTKLFKKRTNCVCPVPAYKELILTIYYSCNF